MLYVALCSEFGFPNKLGKGDVRSGREFPCSLNTVVIHDYFARVSRFVTPYVGIIPMHEKES